MTDFFWLIEAPGPHYLGTRKVGRHEFFWTANPSQATRFMSAAQADGVMMAVRALNPDMFAFAVNLRDARPVEHGWVSTDGASSASTTDPDRAPGMNHNPPTKEPSA